MLVGLFLLAQVLSIAVGPWTGGRRTWAPFHEHATYRIDARLNGETLDAEGIRARYHLYGPHYDASRGLDWQTNRIEHVFEVITRVEARAAERATVEVHYTVDGVEHEPWVLP